MISYAGFFPAPPAAPLPPPLQSLTWDWGHWEHWAGSIGSPQHAPASVPMSLQCCGLWAGEHLGVPGYSAEVVMRWGRPKEVVQGAHPANVSLTFQSVLKAVLIDWKRNGELLGGGWVCTGCYSFACRGIHISRLRLPWESVPGFPYPIWSQNVLHTFST